MILVVVLLATVAYFIFMIEKNAHNIKQSVSENYIIPGVPYYGIHNHIGSTSHMIGNFAGGDSIASALEILEYWNPGQNNFSYVSDVLYKGSSAANGFSFIATSNFTNLFSQQGFSVQSKKLSLSDVGKYINSKTRVPLLLFLPISPDQPDMITYYPATVLFGINEKDQKLTFHSYWLGNNYEISFDEFNQLESRLPAGLQNMYMVIQPKNLNEKVQEIAQRKIENYPARTSVMQNSEQMIKDYAIGSGGAFNASLWPQAMDYLSKVEKAPNFNDTFPPYLKTALYYQMAKMYFLKNDLGNALSYAQKGVAEDHDLDKPFKDWPGYATNYVRPDQPGIIPEPYMVLGNVLDKQGDLNGALQAYKTASDMSLNDSGIRASIQNVELEVAKKSASAVK